MAKAMTTERKGNEETPREPFAMIPRKNAVLYETKNASWVVDGSHIVLQNFDDLSPIEDPQIWTVATSQMGAFDDVKLIGGNFVGLGLVAEKEPGFAAMIKFHTVLPMPLIMKSFRGELPEGCEIRWNSLNRTYQGFLVVDGEEQALTPECNKREDARRHLVEHARFRDPIGPNDPSRGGR